MQCRAISIIVHLPAPARAALAFCLCVVLFSITISTFGMPTTTATWDIAAIGMAMAAFAGWRGDALLLFVPLSYFAFLALPHRVHYRGNPVWLLYWLYWAFFLVLAPALRFACRPAWRRWRVALLAPTLFTLIALYSDPYTLFDLHRGRLGVRFFSFAQFGGPGPNTRRITRLLGATEPAWEYGSPIMSFMRDGDDRIDYCSVVFDDCLGSGLDLLPSDAARKRVPACLTDPSNRARVHQSLLFTSLALLEHPAGYNAESWWARHRWAFTRVSDPAAAARLVYGWREATEAFAPRIRPFWEIDWQRRSCEYQERGGWGGDRELSRAYETIESEVRYAENGEDSPLRGHKEIDWWPAYGSARAP